MVDLTSPPPLFAIFFSCVGGPRKPGNEASLVTRPMHMFHLAPVTQVGRQVVSQSTNGDGRSITPLLYMYHRVSAKVCLQRKG